MNGSDPAPTRKGDRATGEDANASPEILVAAGHTSNGITLADIFGKLFESGERTSLCWQVPGGRFESTVGPAGKIAGFNLPDDRHVWFGINPMREGVDGRGKAKDVTRWAALPADLDVEPGALPSFEAAEAVIDVLSDILEARPTFVISSGHGLQPIWLIDPADDEARLDTPEKRQEAQAVSKGFHRIVAKVAAAHGGEKTDDISDLPRVLRAPGSVNVKREPHVQVTARSEGGRPLAVFQIADAVEGYAPAEAPTPRPATTAAPKLPPERKVKLRASSVDDGEKGELARLHALPRPWRDGAGWDETTYKVACNLLEIENSGVLEPGEAVALVEQHAPTNDVWTIENVRAKIASAKRTVGDTPRDFGPDPADHSAMFGEPVAAPAGGEVVPVRDRDAEEWFWTALPVLVHVRAYARSVRVAPYALLGALLARVAAIIPPGITLPPIVGGRASLNWYLLIIGSSGGGKGAAIAALEEAFADLPPIDTPHPGSGEGLLKLYAHFERAKPAKSGEPAEPGRVVQHSQQVLAIVDEVDTLTALQGRSGSTLMGVLRSAWSGGRLGFAYANDEKALYVAAHEYRLAMIVQGQPERCAPILDDSDGGTPQRFLWLCALDPAAPAERPAPVAPMTLGLVPMSGRRKSMKVPPSVADLLDGGRVAQLHEKATEGLDGHAGLVRLKTAALFAVLDGREDINIYDWHLACHLGDISDRTRAGVQASIGASASIENVQRGRAEGKRKVASEDEVDQARAKRISAGLKRHLADGSLARSDLRRRIAARDRPDVDPILAALAEAGEIKVLTTEHGERISLPEETS